jgi:hypothetical protein
MTERKTERVVETREHSFEKVLGIPSGTTEIVKTRVTSVTAPHDDYDGKDEEIEQDFLDVHDKAMELFDYLADEIDDADQSKRSRLAEVAGQLLNTALNASERRRVLKQHIDVTKQKDRVIDNKATGGQTNNNILVASHEELMKLMETMELEAGEDDSVESTLAAIESDAPPTPLDE